jgi:rSAM/selenodomain-associated transferase 1
MRPPSGCQRSLDRAVAAAAAARYTNRIAAVDRAHGETLVMFAREPLPGRVKTRLAAALGTAGAASLYAAFTEDLCAALARRFRLTVACSPTPASPYFARLARRHGVTLAAQGPGDLGARMQRLAAAALAGARRVVLIGSDVPTLSPARVSHAFAALRRSRVVLGPSLDGGYYLLGLRGPLLATMFTRMPWGGPRVLARTLERLRAARVRPHLLPCWYDVDVPRDLVLLERHLALLATLGEAVPRRTRGALRRASARPRPARAAMDAG